MKRLLCLWLPDWPIQRRVAARLELEGTSLVLHARDPRRGECVAACSAAARRAGVRRGMPLAEASSLAGRAGAASHTLPHDPSADRAALAELAGRCERFSPLVGLETADEPEALLLDVTGIGPLFGGEETLAEAIVEELRDYRVRIGVASTIGCAWALARFQIADCRFQIVGAKGTSDIGCHGLARAFLSPSLAGRSGEEAAAQQTSSRAEAFSPLPDSSRRPEDTDKSVAPERLRIADCGLRIDEPTTSSDVAAFSSNPQSAIRNPQSFPITALRLGDPTLELLARLGIERLDQLLRLPRASLSSRFPAAASGRCELLERLDQFTGAADELIVPHRPPPEFEAEWPLEHPTDRRDVLENILAQLVERVAAMLLAYGRGAIRLACRLDCAGGEPLNIKPLIIQVGLFRPAADPRHLIELLGMQFERLVLPGSVGRVGVQVTLAAPLTQQQGELFADAVRDAPRHLAALVDRLSSRLGTESVLRPELRPDALPERACRYLPLAGRSPKNRRRRSSSPTGPHFAAGDRPLKLISPPAEIETLSIVPDGPPVRFTWRRRAHQVVAQRGPERIETGWWRGRTARRDYYRVETALGQRYWLFRRLDDGRWFLHGVFE